MTELEEALRSELRNWAEAADREVSLLGPVECRVHQVRRRCALAASALATIVGVGVTASVTAWLILQPAQGTAARRDGSTVTRHKPAMADKRAGAPEPGVMGGMANVTEQVIERLPSASLLAFLLTQGPSRSVPGGWRWHDFGGIMFAAPASWGLKREGPLVSCPSGVAPSTVLVSSAALSSVFGCGNLSMAASGKLAAVLATGVVVGAGRYTATEIESAATLAPCLRLGDVRVCMLQPGNSGALLKVAVFPPGSATPALVEIGLARSPVTAQTIFDSIRPAPQPPFIRNSRMNVTAIRAE